MEVEQRAGDKLGHASTLPGKRGIADPEGPAERSLDKQHAGVPQERPKEADDERFIEVLSVTVSEHDDLTAACGQSPPHGIALSERRPELGQDLILLQYACARPQRTRRRAVGRRSVNNDDLIDQTDLAQSADAADNALDGTRNLACREYHADAALTVAGELLQIKVPPVPAAPRTPGGSAKVLCKAARRPSVNPGGGPDAYLNAPRDWHPMVAEPPRQGLVLQRGEWRESTDPPVDPSLDGKRCAAEMVMLGRRSTRGAPNILESFSCTRLTIAQRSARQHARLARIEFDQSADRLRSLPREAPLHGEPVGRNERVGVGRADQPICGQPRARQIHAELACAADAGLGRFDHFKCEYARGVKREPRGQIRAAVEDENDLERGSSHLRAQHLQAAPYS